MRHHVFVYNGFGPKNVTKVFSNVDSVIELFCSIIQSKFNCFETKYEVAFLRCLCELSNIERKQIIRKHKPTSEIAANWKKEERNLQPNGPVEKIRTSFKFMRKTNADRISTFRLHLVIIIKKMKRK